jgi:1-acyl-sn-glycerol-3-phosphate acyltransferase
LNNSVSSARQSTNTRRNADAFVLPQWTLELVRPVVGLAGRAIWKLKLIGLENIPSNGGLVVAANHQSYMDPFLISIPIKRTLRYLAWSAAFDWPVVGKFIRVLGAWPLQIEGSDPAAIRRSLQWLREGGAVMIFPEGRRGLPDGSMRRFKAGAVRMALEANVPILPVTISGAHMVWSADMRVPRGGEISITYHPLFHVEQQLDEEARTCARRETERLAAIIGSAL